MRGYLRETAGTRFEWGKCDCVLWVADFVRLALGFDPAADLRGRYSTSFGARREIIRAGGLLALARRGMRGVPAGSDVCIAEVRGQTYAGLITSELLAIKSETGVVLTREYEVREGWSCRKH